MLTDAQQNAVDLVASGVSIFLTGPAGVGKTVTLNAITKKLKEIHGPQKVAVTASTGICAIAIGGSTLHSFACMRPDPKAYGGVSCSAKAARAWKSCKVLICDEISMISGEIFEVLHEQACKARGNKQPFGGVQLVLCGDFFQLPPVGSNLFAFESNAWKLLAPKVIELTEVFRQDNCEFVALLNSIRHGIVPDNMETILAPCFVDSVESISNGNYMEVHYSKLYATNVDVRQENLRQLKTLPAISEQKLIAIDTGTANYIAQLDKNCCAPHELTLRLGAQVVLLKNLSPSLGLANGSRGVVKELSEHQDWVVVKFANNLEQRIERAEFELVVGHEVVARRTQFPLCLAWALTIHKSQGMSLDKTFINLTKCFAFGQAYVAISRARNLDGLKLLRFPKEVIKAHPRVLRFHQQ